MTSGDCPRPSIDDTFGALARRLPPPLAREADGLAHRLGLTTDPKGGFEDFVVMDPNRDLPRYASEDPRAPGASRLPRASLDAYRRAHHTAAVYGLIADRLADRQVRASATLVSLRDAVGAAWRDALASAVGSRRRAHALVGAALRSLDRGNRAERVALARARRRGKGTLSPIDYVLFTCHKLRWFGASSQGLLLALGEPGRARALLRAYDTFSVALQCLDDALDDERDGAERGASFAFALGVPASGLSAATPALTARASSLASAAGFHELGRWLARVGETFADWPQPGDPAQNAEVVRTLVAASREALG